MLGFRPTVLHDIQRVEAFFRSSPYSRDNVYDFNRDPGPFYLSASQMLNPGSGCVADSECI